MEDFLELAKKICVDAHFGQFDKGGKEYYLHPFHVSEMCEKTDEKIVALLHDVIEDTNLTIDDLRKYKFSDDVLNAVDVITKKTGQNYNVYIRMVKCNPLARIVKIHDMEHNLDLTRLNLITEKDIKRTEKYKHYIDYLID